VEYFLYDPTAQVHFVEYSLYDPTAQVHFVEYSLYVTTARAIFFLRSSYRLNCAVSSYLIQIYWSVRVAAKIRQ
jgi:hypothetical protein